jgi:putative transposase
MIKTLKYRTYPNKTQVSNIDSMLETCRFLYNCALEQRILSYKQNKKSINYYDQANELKEIRNIDESFKNIYSQVLQEVLKNLDNAYKSFFRRAKQNKEKPGFPRFKGKNRVKSICYPQSGFKIEKNRVFLSKIGHIKTNFHNDFLKNVIKVKNCTLKKENNNQYYICFMVEVSKKLLPKTNKDIGIDLGISSFLTDHENNKVQNPKFFKQSQEKLKKKQQSLSKKKKGSKNREKAKLVLQKVYKKIVK